MMTTINLADFGIERLSRDERIALASAILQSVVNAPPIELSAKMCAELDRRIDAYELDPSNVLPWEQVKAELEAKYHK